MKKRYLLPLALLLAVVVRADVETSAVPPPMGGGGATFSGGAITTPLLAPDGTNTAPAFSFSGASTQGFYRSGSQTVYAASSADIWWTAASNIVMRNNGTYRFNSGTAAGGGTDDVFVGREGAAILQLGNDVNGAAVAQTLKSHDGITGSDVAGANLTVAGGRGTGAGTPGDLILQTASPLATGTTAQTLVTRYQSEGSIRSLTDATATTVITVTTGNDLACGGQIFFTAEAADAANHQATSGIVSFAAADNAAGDGGEACASGLAGTNVSAATSGTLTVTTDAVDGGADLCNIRLTATGSLTETIGPRVRYSVVFNPTSSSCAFTPQ